MSNWTYIDGVLTVSPLGRTQEEMTYILQTVLKHLPVIQGSEGELQTFINLTSPNCFSSCDEFQESTNNLVDYDGWHTWKGGMQYADDYILTLHAALCDRYFRETFRDFQKWLCRLAKRVWIHEILVRVSDCYNETIIDNYRPYFEMFEDPSWANDTTEPNWCEYMMWKPWNHTSLPLELTYKYYKDPEADKEFERRLTR